MLNKKIIASVLFSIIAVWALALTPVLAQDDEEETSGQDSTTIACCEKEAKTTDNSKGAITTENLTEKGCNDLQGYNHTNWFRNKTATANTCKDKPAEVQQRIVGDPIYFTPQVTIPESEYAAGANIKMQEDTSLIAKYVIAIFKYAIGVIGIIAAIVLMFGGVRWLTSGGNSSAISEAKSMIVGSLSGLLLALCSFLLLSTINTELVNFKIQSVKPIQKIDLTTSGCCKKVAQDGSETTATMTSAECENIKKTEVSATGYKDVQFLIDKEADANKCVDSNGCCLLDLGTQVAFFEWPWGDHQLCINKLPKYDCSNAESSGVKNWIPWVGDTKDVDAKMFLGKKCQEVSDCSNDFICETIPECLEKLKKKENQ